MVLTAIEVRQKGKTRKMSTYALFRRKSRKKADFSEVTCLESLQKLQNIVICHRLKALDLFCTLSKTEVLF